VVWRVGTISSRPIVLISGVSAGVVDAGDRDWVSVRVDTEAFAPNGALLDW
jgi:hypothetical protein